MNITSISFVFLAAIYAVSASNISNDKKNLYKNRIPLIINGNAADVGEWPWQVRCRDGSILIFNFNFDFFFLISFQLNYQSFDFDFTEIFWFSLRQTKKSAYNTVRSL